MSSYRYLFCDTLTNTVLAELPLTSVNGTQALNAAGTLTGDLLLSGVNAKALNVSAATIPMRCSVYVDRDGTIIWGGIIVARDYNSSTQHLKISAREFESYFERRRITSSINFTAVDQFTIAQTLINNAQAVSGGNIGVAVPTNLSGVAVSKTYYNYELKSVYSALLDLSQATNGFDFNIQCSYDGSGNPSKTLVLSYPRSGIVYSSSSPTAPVFEFPAGNVVEYQLTEDGSTTAETIYALGAGNSDGKLIATASSTTNLAAGWPLLEDSINYSDISDATLLGNLATGRLNGVTLPPQTLKLVVPPFVDPVYNDITYKIGDDCRVRILDDRFPTQLDQTYRITSLSFSPGENNQPERVVLGLTLSTI